MIALPSPSILFVPPSKPTTADRNAIPNAQRREGMLIYVSGTQITYQLNPAPWDGTNADWVVFSAINPYTAPIFTAFRIDNQGDIVVDGTTISGTVTFLWSTSPSANVAASSISIRDVTLNVTLATALADDGSQSVALPDDITLNTGDSHVWRITGTDSKGNPFTKDFTVTCVEASDTTYYVRTDGSDSNTGLANNSGGAWLTLQHAADSVSVGDTVQVQAGTFEGFVLGWDTPNNGASGHPIWFKGNSSTINHRNARTTDAIDVEACSYIKVSGFTITNDGTVSRAGIRMSSGGSGNEISGNTVTGTGRFGIITGFLTDFTISGNTVSGILGSGGAGTGHGIYSANGGDRGTISHNIISNCTGDGIHTNGDVSQGGTGIQTNLLIEANTISDVNNAYGGAGINCDGILNSVFQNNLIYDAHSAGIALYVIDASAASTGNVVVNNTILCASDSPPTKGCLRLANGSAGNVLFDNILWNAAMGGVVISADEDSIPVSDYNLAQSRFSIDSGSTVLTLAQWQTATDQDANSIVMTSLASVFTAPGSNDYTPLISGPAINAGTQTFSGATAPDEDLNGDPRPFAGEWDVGCYESQTVSVLVVDKSPADGATGVATSAVVTMTFDRDVDPDSIVFDLADGGSVAGTITYDSPSKTATFTPDDPLAGDTFTATLSAVTGVDLVTLASPVVWSFSTISTHRLFTSGYTPPTGDAGDATNLTLGLFFYSTEDAQITKVWLYRNSSDTGTMTAKVWDLSENLLATKVLGSGAYTGWQSVTLDTPVSITANTRYVVSWHMPSGHYAFDNTIHTRSNSPLFTGDVIAGSTHPSAFVTGDASPVNGTPTDSFYGIDVETSS